MTDFDVLSERMDHLERKIITLQASLAAVVSGIEDQENGLYLSPILSALQRLDARLRELDAPEEDRRTVSEIQTMIWELRNSR